MGESGPESRQGRVEGSHTMGHCAGDDVRHDVLLYMWRAPRSITVIGGGQLGGWRDG
jgi:hypothetical protein